MFNKILIANRGEIACRIMRTAGKLGVRTVAVYSDADRDALHKRMADEACHIGAAPAAESYLHADAIIACARRCGAEAIHPGYGFLSENAAFAEACAAAGIVFIGPTPEAIRLMGAKREAKVLMERHGVPVVPGYHGKDQSDAELSRRAVEIGFPVLIKASAGGGGRGMRIVRDAAGFEAALVSGRREARASFGDDTVILEKYLDRPRHIEVQVFGDRHGNYVHLFERDCSVQRRYQKVVEEAPAPGLSDAQRVQIHAAALRAARAIHYQGAGTIEFIVAPTGEFHFMEMNTRLQVEHPVTEMITGRDLVEWQLRIAAGEPLPCRQEDLRVSGHAIETRVYAEDPENDFRPSTGQLHHLAFPVGATHTRVDTGVQQGDSISAFYDAMIAKLVTWSTDRDGALAAMRHALAATEIVGVVTNTRFLKSIIDHPGFCAGAVDTHFIAGAPGLVGRQRPPDATVLTLACLDALARSREQAAALAVSSGDPTSPWGIADGWRMHTAHRHPFVIHADDDAFELQIGFLPAGYTVTLPGGEQIAVSARRPGPNRIEADIAGISVRATAVRRGDLLDVITGGEHFRLRLSDPMAPRDDDEGDDGSLVAPMPGTIRQVMVEPGQRVTRGTPLLVLEAMKMEHTISAPTDGTIAAIHFAAGEFVPREGTQLLTFEVEADA